MDDTNETPENDQPPKRRPEWWDAFLAVLRETANVRLACQRAGVVRRKAYRYRERYPHLAEEWDDCVDEAVDSLEAEALLRAKRGRDKAVWYKGKQVGTVQNYSDWLLMALLKAHRPEKYREHFNLEKLVNQLAEHRETAASKQASNRTGRGRRSKPGRDVA